MINMSRTQQLDLIFQIVADMTKKPIVMLARKRRQLLENIFFGRERVHGICPNQPFIGVMPVIVLVVIQKTTDVELVCPVQHLLLKIVCIGYRESFSIPLHSLDDN
jgi:hypothetical protein